MDSLLLVGVVCKESVVPNTWPVINILHIASCGTGQMYLMHIMQLRMTSTSLFWNKINNHFDHISRLFSLLWLASVMDSPFIRSFNLQSLALYKCVNNNNNNNNNSTLYWLPHRILGLIKLYTEHTTISTAWDNMNIKRAVSYIIQKSSWSIQLELLGQEFNAQKRLI